MRLQIKFGLFIMSTLLYLYAQGTVGNGGGGFGRIADTIPDTLYYQSESFSAKEKIYSITLYNTDLTVKKYTVFFVNGTIYYYSLYDYVNKICVKDRYYNSTNQLTFYGEYSDNSYGGRDYKYYNKDGILIYDAQYDSALSALDSTWQCHNYTVRTINDKVLNRIEYKYINDGWLSEKIFLDSIYDTTGVGICGYDPRTNITAYVFKCKNDNRLYNSMTKIWYDEYRYYYHDILKIADSLKIYSHDTLIYTTKYEYDSKGWLLKERIYDKSNTPVFRGEYTFDKSTLITKYSYFQEPSTLQFEKKTDYQGLVLSTDYYSSGQLSSTVKYSYNDGNYWDTLTKDSLSGIRISYETYSYYLPYYVIKRYASFDASGNITSYYNYNEYGHIIDSMPFQSSVLMDNGIYNKTSKNILVKDNRYDINLFKNSVVQWIVVDPSGRQVSNFEQQLTAGPHQIQFIKDPQIAAGNYLVKGKINSTPVNGKIRYMP